ncbi:hypothetical protein ACVWWQ_003063 [Rhodanobacter sp. TND4EL1]
MSNLEHTFPFELLPKAGQFPLPMFQAAVQECLNERKVPLKMPYFTAAAAYCAAAQQLANMITPTGDKLGTNIYALVSAISGEGKTGVRLDFFRAFDEVNSKLKRQFKQAEAHYREQEYRWKREGQVLSAELATAPQTGLSAEAIQLRIDEHYHRKPVEPCELDLSMKEPKYASLLLALTNFPCTTIVSGDCAKYLRTTILPFDTLFCDTWSYEVIDDPRVSVASYYREDPRLAMLLMIQPSKLATILKSALGQEGLDSGLFARIVYCNAERTGGGRFLDIGIIDTPVETRCRDEFNLNLKELLLEGAQAMATPGYRRRELRFNKDAAELWIRYFNFVEEQRQPGGRYERAIECAARLAENVARMSAGFHVAERFKGDEIGVECLLCAIAICDESSKDYMGTFVRENPEEADAMRLYGWLVEKLRTEPARNGGRVRREHDLSYVSSISRLAPGRRMRGKSVHGLIAILVQKKLVEIRFVPVGRGQTAEKIRLLDLPSQWPQEKTEAA